MSQKVAMRTGKDRLRYTVSFEFLLMAILVPAGAAFFDKPLSSMGVLSLMLATKAMVINLIYNWVFDWCDARRGKISSDRSPLGRILHAIGFEMVLVISSLPIYMWWLDLTLLEALATDIVITSFVVAYTYAFTLVYDRIFPVVVRVPCAG